MIYTAFTIVYLPLSPLRQLPVCRIADRELSSHATPPSRSDPEKSTDVARAIHDELNSVEVGLADRNPSIQTVLVYSLIATQSSVLM